ncbi:MSHA biogenesis protein MshC [Massilia horti]|uniref:MSHA biogenesis protein MshC n=2 Tax=Massilia horti TaxID=2562153 RepID=A0A4Y9SW17_9BURK|nr:MSHA biogenesis protein MshC [Massilia horti]
MVELIVVMVLAGIIGAVGIARFFDRAGFDADAFADQTRSMLRYAQKLAIAGNRPVYVRLNANGISLCYDPAKDCPPAKQVLAPSGTNSGVRATRDYCNSSAWYCEGRPSTVTLNVGGNGLLVFDALGRPSDGSPQFSGIQLAIGGDGSTRTVSVAPETGYVF